MENNKIKDYVEIITQGSGDEREEAVISLGQLGADAIEAAPTLIEAIKEDDLCWEAVNALGNIGGKDAMHALSEALLNDIDMGVRFRAADALAKINNKEAVPALIKALKDRDEYVRESAASALGKIGDSSAVSALNEALKDQFDFVTKAAANALEKITSNS